MFSLATMAAFGAHKGASILAPGRSEKDVWQRCPVLVERRPNDPIAWGYFANWSEHKREQEGPNQPDVDAWARCWVLSGDQHGKLRDYAGVRLVEEGVYPAAVEQARRELGLD